RVRTGVLQRSGALPRRARRTRRRPRTQERSAGSCPRPSDHPHRVRDRTGAYPRLRARRTGYPSGAGGACRRSLAQGRRAPHRWARPHPSRGYRTQRRRARPARRLPGPEEQGRQGRGRNTRSGLTLRGPQGRTDCPQEGGRACSTWPPSDKFPNMATLPESVLSPQSWVIITVVGLLGAVIGLCGGRLVRLFGPVHERTIPGPRESARTGNEHVIPLPFDDAMYPTTDPEEASPTHELSSGTDQAPPPPRCPHCMTPPVSPDWLLIVTARRSTCPYCGHLIHTHVGTFIITAVLFVLVGAVP